MTGPPQWAPEAIRLYGGGLSLREVGRRVGVCASTVQRWMEIEGVARRARGGARAQTRIAAADATWGAQAEALYRAGAGAPAVARQLGISAHVQPEVAAGHVRDVLRARGVPIRQRGAAAATRYPHAGRHLVGRFTKPAAALDPRTRTVYGRRWRVYTRWCAAHGRDPAPTGPGGAAHIERAVQAFAADQLAAGRAPRGVTALITAVRHHLTAAGLPVPDAVQLRTRPVALWRTAA